MSVGVLKYQCRRGLVRHLNVYAAILYRSSLSAVRRDATSPTILSFTAFMLSAVKHPSSIFASQGVSNEDCL